jgi:OOP family OmpA-OmpF porin
MEQTSEFREIMMSKQTTLAVVMGLALSMASAASWAEGGGWYFGVTGGQAEADLNKAEFDDLVIFAFESNGATVLSGNSTLEDKDTSFSLFGGYRISEYFAVEAGYVDFGAAEYRSSGMVDPIGSPPVPATYSADFEVTGLTATAIGAVPVGSAFDVHGRAGILFADTEISERATMSSSAASNSFSADSQDFFYGLGVGLQVGQNWSFSLDWQQFKDVGDEDETGETDINRLSLGVIYRL